MKFFFRAAILVAAMTVLASCDNADERAEKHFQSALELIEAGDDQRAIIEFRNVFKLNGTHREARKAYAAFQKERGDYQEALGQYLRLVEQYPDEFEGQLAISEIYAETGNWEGMERFLLAAAEIAPDNQKTRALQLVFDYRQAVADEDFEKAGQVAASVTEFVKEMPDYLLLRQVEIDDDIRSEAYDSARTRLDEAILRSPDNQALYAVRLSVLNALEDHEAIETQLIDMISRFPEDPAPRATLVRWYVSQAQLDDAEHYLRLAAEAPDANTDDQLVLIRFLNELRGSEVAQNELKRMVDAGDASPILSSLQAGYRFDSGDTDGAISQMRDLISTLQSGDETEAAKVALAQMYILTDELEQAKALVAEVLAENGENVAALKLHADWLITDDKIGDAITTLRGALEFAPRDSEILNLLARAYGRDGNQALMGEMLALSMDASNKAPEQTILYAKFLVEREKHDVAERVLVEALRQTPDNLGILTELGKIYIATADWPRAEQVLATMRKNGSTQSNTAANELQARLLQAQQKFGEAVDFLQGLAEQGTAGIGAHAAIIESYLTGGDTARAKEYVDNLLLDDPNDPAIKFLDATLDVAVGANESAEKKYRALVSADPNQLPVWVALFRLLMSTDREEDATAAISQARENLPDDATLKWISAGLLENQGDVAGAIEIYENMYAIDSDNLIIANNLASLLSTSRQDTASLDRAYVIARRLRSSGFAPYQDTYGWIAHLRGETEEAIRALEAAAVGLANDPLVQYHLAEAYLAGKRKSDASVKFQQVLDMIDGEDDREFVVAARERLALLAAEAAAEGEN